MFKRLIATTLAGAALTAGSVFGLAGSSAVAAGASSCPTGTWDSATVGRPPSATAGMNGAAIWRSSTTTDVFHVRASEPGRDPAIFWGSVQTDGVLVYRGRHLEGGDLLMRRTPQRFVYAFSNFGGVDGFDVGVLCASYVRISVRENRSWLPLADIVLGAGDTTPSANPVTITKA